MFFRYFHIAHPVMVDLITIALREGDKKLFSTGTHGVCLCRKTRMKATIHMKYRRRNAGILNTNNRQYLSYHES